MISLGSNTRRRHLRLTPSLPNPSYIRIHAMLLATLSLALVAIGILASSTPTDPAPYTWTVHNFNGTCTASTCFAWSFSISGPVGPLEEPAFVASDCDWNLRNELEYQLCQGVQSSAPSVVGVRIYEPDACGGLLGIEYTFQQ